MPGSPSSDREEDAQAARAPLLGGLGNGKRNSFAVYRTMGDGSVRGGVLFLNDDIRLYARRWLVLALFSLASATNNVISFQYSPVAHAAREFFDCSSGGVHLLVLVHFVAYMALSTVGSYLVTAAGLYPVVCGGALLQAGGAWIRVWGSGFERSRAERYGLVLLGQTVASAAAPAFVNPPPLLSSLWFDERGRTLATAASVQANFIGIALAFVLSPHVVRYPGDIPALDFYVAVWSSLLAVATLAFFAERPPSPPTLRAAVAEADPDPRPNLRETFRQSLGLFRSPAFSLTVVAFAAAETIFNVVPIFLNQSLVPEGFSPQFVGWLGAGFIVAGGAGGFLGGLAVDATGAHKLAMVASLAAAAAGMGSFAAAAAGARHRAAVVAAVLSAGFFLGPVEPIGAELGCEATAPAPEATVCALQSLLGQVCSLLAVPAMEALRDPHTGSMRLPNAAAAAALAAAALLFALYRPPRRPGGGLLVVPLAPDAEAAPALGPGPPPPPHDHLPAPPGTPAGPAPAPARSQPAAARGLERAISYAAAVHR